MAQEGEAIMLESPGKLSLPEKLERGVLPDRFKVTVKVAEVERTDGHQETPAR